MNKISSEILNQYTEASEFEYYNTGDQDLQAFRIKLPQPEKIEKITNYGLPADQQMFVREQTPTRFKELIESTRDKVGKFDMSANEKELEFTRRIWKVLYDYYEYYRDIHNWIKTQWYHRLYGKWYFINGKPTYIDGFHWFYLNYWNLEQIGLPDYRDRDRRWFIAQRYLMTTQEAPWRDSHNDVKYHPDGTLIMEDVGARTFIGSNILKGRQRGDTSKAQCIEYEIISRTPEGRGGIQAENERTSNFVFLRKLKLPVKKLAFFFRPTMKDINPSRVMDFSSKERGKGIDASIDYATTVYKNFYDGENLNIIHVDEPGKLDQRESVKERHEILVKCLRELKGFMINTTTVYQMESHAAREFLELTKQSHFHDRDQSGRTISGLANVFFSAVEAANGFIGKFGESITDTPTPEQVPYLGRRVKNRKGEYMGSKEALLADQQKYRAKGDLTGLSNEKRMEPIYFRDCFTPTAKGQFFDHEIVSNRLSHLRMNPPDHVIRGNFVWVGTRFSNKVQFIQDDNGRWLLSKRLTGNEANKIIRVGDIYHPNNGWKFISSSDVFRANNLEGGKMSNGGGAVYMVWDKEVDDPNEKSSEQFETRKFVCTYDHRPDTVPEFVEDMLKMDIYFGAHQYPESNITHVEDYYKEWGYAGYLLYDINKTTNKLNNVAGFNTNHASKPVLFNKGRDWVKSHGSQCDHEDLLEEFNNIRNPDDLTNHDLLASALGCLKGEDRMVDRMDIQESIQGIDLADFHQQHYY